MKAVILDTYGSPDLLKFEDVPKPVPKDNEILVRVRATTVTAGDARLRRADPFLIRLLFGLRKPKRMILGLELAGEVEAVGNDVTRFKKGDRVFGSSGFDMGCHAEYKCVPDSGAIATIPDNMAFKDIVAVSFGGGSALHFLKKQGKIKSGEKVLIYGASGAVGTYAVQLAKYYGAEVTGVCGPTNVELVKSLGADRVIDYTKENFTADGRKYDIVFETVGKAPLSDCLKSLKDDGRYLGAVYMLGSLLGYWTNHTTKKKVIGGVAEDFKDDMEFLKGLIVSGKIKPVIDRVFPFEQIAEAHRIVDSGRKKGNIVVTI